MKNRIVLFLIVMAIPLALLPAQETRRDAAVLYEEGKYKEAIEVCRAEIVAEPNSVSYYVMGWCYLALGQYRTVVTEMNNAEPGIRKHRKIIHILAEAHFRLGEYEKSEEYCIDYIKNAPNGESIGEVYYFLGEIFLRMKEYEHADIAFLTALHYQEKKSDWWTRLGYCRQQARKYDQAINAYDQAIRLNPGNEAALKGRSECEKLLGA
ncbi:MAG: tetratricopeptide repeat protein [Spirochaetales bacterium]|nr:tetratricopeptide repeat protein [Spirochaetales bacterium]